MKQTVRTTCALIALTLTLGALPAFAGDAGVVNVNSAGVEQLALLPRVGPAVAQRIVDYREANGAFKALEDLMLVRGIGEKTFDLIKPYAALSGETTLKEKVRVPRGEAAEADAEGGSR
jgi:competence protein ComEA